MHSQPPGHDAAYNRDLLLHGSKRNEILELWEVERYGIDNYGDAEYVSLYGMRPAQWHAAGVRILGRTAVECTRDALADAIGTDVSAIAAQANAAEATFVLDPFAGSGNTLYWLTRHLQATQGLGFELDARVFDLARRNIALLGIPIEILHTGYRSAPSTVAVTPDTLLMIFIAPPWGDALHPVSGLDLRRTEPPVVEIVQFLFDAFPRNRLLCAIQIYEQLDTASVGEVQQCFDWVSRRLYSLNAPGRNHGILMGTKGFTPRGE